ncbi:MAG: hypothetical protein FJ308_20950, partial [Planctomycetes bacterium]|nr:hypothetical protein [Planctomycetota bacterium]
MSSSFFIDLLDVYGYQRKRPVELLAFKPGFLVRTFLMVMVFTIGNGYCDEVSELHAVLTSEASLHDKGVACRRLMLIGNDDSIPFLDNLLDDDGLSHLARVALEAIPSKRVDALFRTRLESARGELLIGIIDSIGNRRDAQSVSSLLKLLLEKSSDEISAAILHALSDIATVESSAAIRNMITLPDGLRVDLLADCAMRCADRLAKDGNTQDALSMLQLVQSKAVSVNLLAAATLAIIRLSKDGGLPLIAEMIGSPSETKFAVGLQAARSLPSQQVAPILCRELDSAPADRTVLILNSLADLGDKSVLGNVKKTLDSGAPRVRAAAARALGRLGDASVVPDLFAVCRLGLYPEVESNALRSLAQLEGSDVDRAILDAARDGSQDELIALRLIGERRIRAPKVLQRALISLMEEKRIVA